MPTKLHIKKGDTVFVTTGESKGKQAKVIEVYPKENKALVEGVNLVKKHTKANAKQTNGGIVQKEAPVHVSNLMLIDPKSKKPTRIGRRLNDKGKLVRYAKKSGEEIK